MMTMLKIRKILYFLLLYKLYAVPIILLHNNELQAHDPLPVSCRRRFESQEAELTANETDALL
jgi:hypothetical protein